MSKPPPGVPLNAYWLNIAKWALNLDLFLVSFDYKNIVFSFYVIKLHKMYYIGSGGPRGAIGAKPPPGPAQSPKIFSLTSLGMNFFKYPKLHILHNYHKNNVHSMWGPCCRGMYALRKVFPIRRTVVSSKIQCLNILKDIIKRYLENKENAYSAKKNPWASRALRQALDPGLLKLTSFMWLCFAMLGNFVKNNLGTPWPKSWVRHWLVTLYGNISEY